MDSELRESHVRHLIGLADRFGDLQTEVLPDRLVKFNELLAAAETLLESIQRGKGLLFIKRKSIRNYAIKLFPLFVGYHEHSIRWTNEIKKGKDRTEEWFSGEVPEIAKKHNREAIPDNENYLEPGDIHSYSNLFDSIQLGPRNGCRGMEFLIGPLKGDAKAIYARVFGLYSFEILRKYSDACRLIATMLANEKPGVPAEASSTGNESSPSIRDRELESIEDELRGQSLTLFRFLLKQKHWTGFDTIRNDTSGIFNVDDPGDDTIEKAIRRLNTKLLEFKYTVEVDTKRAKLVYLGPQK